MRFAIVLALASACEKSETPVRPDPIPVPIPPLLDAGTLPISACYTLVLRIDPGGTWIGAPADVRCYAPFKSGAPDAAWIEAELLRLRTKIYPSMCRPVVEVGATTGITYQQLVTAFEGMHRAAFTKVDVVEPDALAMMFDVAQRPSQCTGDLDLNKVARKPKPKRPPLPPAPPPAPTPGTPTGSITQQRRIAVSREAIFLDARRIAGIGELPIGVGTIASLANAIGTANDDIYSAIVAADASTDAALLHRIVSTLKAAGYDYIAFEAQR